MLVKLTNVGLRRGGRPIVDGIDFTLDNGQRMGISGRNGCGKSTLLNTICEKDQPDSGTIEYKSDMDMVVLGQHALEQQRKAIDFVLDGHRRFREVERQKEQALADNDARAIALAEEAFALMDGYRMQSDAARILAGLGFSNEAIAQPVGSFSGGWQQRLLLARALIQPADLLLLDEPTNHLDLEAIDWLARWLVNQPASLIVIDHGRSFLEAISTHTLLMRNGSAKLYTGGVNAAQRQAAEAIELQELEAKRINKKREELERFITRFKAKASKAAQARSRQKALDKLQEVVSNPVDPIYQWSWGESDSHHGPLIRLHEVDAGYDEKKILERVSVSIESGERIGIVGINGCGKSTLINTLVGELTPSEGERWLSPRLSANIFAQNAIEQLPISDTALNWFTRQKPEWREQQVRNYLGSFGMGKDEVEREINTLSGGERSRLVLAHMASEPSNVLVLDEPTNHLDMNMRASLSASLQDYQGAVIVVSHDKDVLSQIVDKLIVIDNGTVTAFNDSLDAYLQNRHQSGQGNTQLTQAENKVGQAESKKAKRQQAAQQRALQAPIRSKMTKLEKEMDRLAGLISEIDLELEQEGLYSNDEGMKKATELNAKRHSFSYDAADIESKWLELAEELERYT